MSAIHNATSFTFAAMLILGMPASAEQNKAGRPGDAFREAAVAYDNAATKAVRQATRAQGKVIGKYLELSATYKEMAAIKRSAADLADQGRRDEIDWGRYQQLEVKRDQLMKQSGLGFARGKSNHESIQDIGATNKHDKKQGSSSHDFVRAAEQYDKEASYARDHAGKTSGEQKAMYLELADTYQDMADIKREAAVAAQAGRGYDWSLYKRLSQRRDHLKKSIKQARK